MTFILGLCALTGLALLTSQDWAGVDAKRDATALFYTEVDHYWDLQRALEQHRRPPVP